MPNTANDIELMMVVASHAPPRNHPRGHIPRKLPEGDVPATTRVTHDGIWWIPYEVMFPLGSTLDWLTEDPEAE